MAGQGFTQCANTRGARRRAQQQLSISTTHVNAAYLVSRCADKSLLALNCGEITGVLFQKLKESGFSFQAQNRMVTVAVYDCNGIADIRADIDHGQIRIFSSHMETNFAQVGGIIREFSTVERKLMRKRQAQIICAQGKIHSRVRNEESQSTNSSK